MLFTPFVQQTSNSPTKGKEPASSQAHDEINQTFGLHHRVSVRAAATL